MDNRYTAAWFDVFLSSVPPEQTAAEVAFITRQLPLPDYQSVLDLCCGFGRHAQGLASAGYQVTGVDRDGAVLAEARRRAEGTSVVFLAGDLRDVATLPDGFDAALNLWQSFGYFDEATNTDILRQIGHKLRPGGRFILDIYNRGFFAQYQGDRSLTRDGVTVVERKQLIGNRLTVVLEYGSGRGSDTFSWQLFTPQEIIALAADHGFKCLLACAGFDEGAPPTETLPRMQFVFERW